MRHARSIVQNRSQHSGIFDTAVEGGIFQVLAVVNLDVPQAGPGERINDVVVTAVGEPDEESGHDKAAEHTQDGEQGAAFLTEHVAKGHFQDHLCLLARTDQIRVRRLRSEKVLLGMGILKRASR